MADRVVISLPWDWLSDQHSNWPFTFSPVPSHRLSDNNSNSCPPCSLGSGHTDFAELPPLVQARFRLGAFALAIL